MFVLGLLLALAGSARAGNWKVTNLNDSGPGSLRQAILDAGVGDMITFNVTGTIALTSGALTISQDWKIQGPGPNKLTISGDNESRVFVINSGTATIAGMTTTGGLTDASLPDFVGIGGIGGRILNLASLSLSKDVVSDNAALGDVSTAAGFGCGGGLGNFGPLDVTACEFTGHLDRGGDGSNGEAVGGTMGNFLGPVTIADSQFIGNVAQGGNGNLLGGAYGGAICVESAPATINGCTLDHITRRLGAQESRTPTVARLTAVVSTLPTTTAQG